MAKLNTSAERTTPIRYVCPALVACLVLPLALAAPVALIPAQPVTPYIKTNFTVENGLPSNVVNAVLQTRDGFLWIGTGDGLVRFDGRHFNRVESTQQSFRGAFVSSLAEAPDGALWVGTSGGLFRIPNEALNQFGRIPAISYLPGLEASHAIQCLRFSRDGVLWVGTGAGLFRWEHGSFSSILPTLMISRIEEASNGHLLVITSRGFVEWDGRQEIPHPDLPAQLGVPTNGIFHVFEDSRGVRWYCTSAGVARSTNGSLKRLAPFGVKVGNQAFRAYEDSSGVVWLARYLGLSRATPDGLELVVPEFHARHIAFDRDGDLWTGTNGDGLFKFRARTIRMFTKADGLPIGVPVAVLAGSDGKLWVGNNCGGLSQFDGKRFQTYADKDGLTNSCVFTLAEDGEKNIWIGTFGGGVFRFRDGVFTQFLKPDQPGSGVARAIVPAKDGSIWIANNDTLSQIRNGQVRGFTTADGLSSNRVQSVFEDHGGTIWAESSSGVDRLIHGRFVPAATVQDFVFGEDRLGQVFAFTHAGSTFHIRANGLVELKGAPQISGMVESPKNIWFCGEGIYRVLPGSLENWERQPDAPRDYTRFGRLDGMNSAECSGGFPNLAIAKDGNLWAATNQGLAMLDVSRISLSDRKPAAYLEKVVLEKTVQTAGRELIVPPGTHHIELHFDAIELAAPERIRLQYRLDDVDSEWLDADSSASAVYSGFPNGTHKFHVRACNGAGVWDLEGIDYSVTQKPYYFETNLFRLAVAAVVFLFLAAAYNLRLRRLKGQMNARLNERVMERTQVARELHDTLLQTIQASKMVADDALDQPADLHLRKALERLSIWLGQAIQEGRAALGALRASTTQTNNLASALRQACAECVISGSMTPTVTVNGTAREIHPIVLDDIQRIAFEAIRNACAHSRATELNVELKYGPDLELRVRDNGIGLDPELLITGKDRHFGLQGMQERADRIGAKLRFHPKTPGTEVDLFVPRSVAYYEKKLDSKG